MWFRDFRKWEGESSGNSSPGSVFFSRLDALSAALRFLWAPAVERPFLLLMSAASQWRCPPALSPRGREHELRASFLSFFDREQSELLKILRNMFKCCPSHLLFRTSKARPLKKGSRGRWVLRLREGDLLAHSHSQVRWAFSSFFGRTTTGHLQSWARA